MLYLFSLQCFRYVCLCRIHRIGVGKPASHVAFLSPWVQALCYEFQGQWMLPLGHALLFDRTSAPLANLKVEWQGRWRGRDVLTFSATKDIHSGEAFGVAGAHGAPFRAVLEGLRRTGTTFQAAASECGLLHSGVREDMTVSQSNVMLLAGGFEHV